MSDTKNPPSSSSQDSIDELRKHIVDGLKDYWLRKLQTNHPIYTVETLLPAASDFANSQLEDYDQAKAAWHNTQLKAVLESLRAKKLRVAASFETRGAATDPAEGEFEAVPVEAIDDMQANLEKQ